MILKNGRVFTENGVFIDADVELKDGKIVKVAPRGTLSGDEELDVQGKYVTPALWISISTAQKARTSATTAQSTLKP